jgi:hypothetical protein
VGWGCHGIKTKMETEKRGLELPRSVNKRFNRAPRKQSG